MKKCIIENDLYNKQIGIKMIDKDITVSTINLSHQIDEYSVELLSKISKEVCFDNIVKSKIVIEHHTINDDIPVLYCYNNEQQDMPLIICNHGYGSNKESDISNGIKLASEGFFVVLLDASLHGERKSVHDEELFSEDNYINSFVHVLLDTVKDIKSLLDYFANDDRVDIDRVGIMGISMGGFVSFLAASQDPRIKVVCPLIGSPDWNLFINDLATLGLKDDEVERLTQEYNPIKHYRLLFDKALLVQNGANDMSVSVDGARELDEIARSLPNEDMANYRYIEYKEQGHVVTAEMINNCIDWFKKHLLSHSHISG